MKPIILFQRIIKTVIDRSVAALVHIPVVTEDMTGELREFYDQFEACVITGDYKNIHPILLEWASAQTQTDVSGNPSNLTQTIRQLMKIFLEVSEENLERDELAILIVPVMDVFGYTLEKSSELQIIALRRSYESQKKNMEDMMNRLEKSKSSFISVAAHELRTPLTLIEGYAAMIQSTDMKNTSSGEKDILLGGIFTGASRLRYIINDMIDISLIDNSMLTLNVQTVWLSTIFEALSYEFENVIKERSQVLTVVSSQGLATNIDADPDRIMQVFRNIINNAIKFTPDGGKITINGRLLPGFVEVTVTDTGIGIAPEDQIHIFEKFGGLGQASLHSSGKSKFKGGGPGLGLSIAKGIIEAHRGTIWVESEGKDEVNYPGSTFHVLLPHHQRKITKLQ